jgi:2-keto-3-deoxy-galactonokinase
LEQGSESSAEQRLSFLIGAFLASDMDAMVSRGLLAPESAVVITGGGLIAEAWRDALAHLSMEVVILDEAEVESAMLRGCRSVFSTLANDFRNSSL